MIKFITRLNAFITPCPVSHTEMPSPNTAPATIRQTPIQTPRRSKRQRKLSTRIPSPPPVDSHSSPSQTPPSPPRRRTRTKPLPSKLHFPTTSSKKTLIPAEISALRTNLLDWYLVNHRKLPWRLPPSYRKNAPPLKLPSPPTPSSPGSPYSIWVSEVMSQQTRLSVVEAYYARWMTAFPTIRALADAPLERVNQLWAGLGYYRRARFLHEGAKQIVAQYDACLPTTLSQLRNIRGVGPYTAGAIASIAFGKNVPLVDGNVQRVLARLCPGLGGDQRVIPAPKFWHLAALLVEGVQSPGDFNQALMELGATVCKPKLVLCAQCPLQAICGAYEEAISIGQVPEQYVTRYPVKDPKKATKVRAETLFVLVLCLQTEQGDKFLLFQRPGNGLLAGLWEAPNVLIGGTGEGDMENAMDTVQTLLSEVPTICSSVENGKEVPAKWTKPDLSMNVGTVTHIFSHIRQSLDIRLYIFRPKGATSALVSEGVTEDGILFRWLSEDELGDGAVSTQMKKVFSAAIKKLPKAKRIRQ